MAPVNPVLDPAASGVGRVAPVSGEVLEPAASRDEQPTWSSSQTVVPLIREAAQPAMTMLGASLPKV